MLLQSGFELPRKKTGKFKVMVRNPFERKLSKSPQSDLFNESQIFKNESRISHTGKKDLAQIISLL
jgi:hypothetical protein